MKGVRNNHHHSYKFSFLLVFLVLSLLHPVFSIYISTLSSTQSLTISSNRTIVSNGGDFELGFFKPSAQSRWYLGIWYKKVPDRTYAWVANRDNPLSKPIGTLKISGNNLLLLDHSGKLVWSTNLTRGNVRSPVVAELLSNGNFVMRYFNKNNNDPSGFLWQSFDFPTDTLLPQMKLGLDRKTGLNRFLISWRSRDDPSSGNHSYKLEVSEYPEFFLWDEDVQAQRSGPWNGMQFNGIPEVRVDYMVYNFTDNKDEIAYTFLMTNQSIYSRLTVGILGSLERYTWIPPLYGWRQFWFVPTDNCDMYGVCGPYGYCDMNTSPACNCIRGFDPRNPQDWMLRVGSAGCARRTQLSCRGDGFTRLRKIKLPETTSVIVDRSISTKECKKRCLKDCNCTAFANADITKGGSGCVIWTGQLFDIRKYAAGGQDLYVRLAAADIEKERKISGKIIGLIVGIIIILLSFTMFSIWKRKQKRANTTAGLIVDQERTQDLTMNEVVISSSSHVHSDDMTEDLDLPLLEFKVVVMATENFSEFNMLGKGGFGVVYKGRLPNGQEIAVKRLSKMSLQGNEEFMNELRLIAKLQHINLVRLLGCCIEANEKMLIYEYLENLGLDSYLFDTTRSYKLDWQKRFEIANGIARGLLYLHQDSRFRIIHRDLKASNVLLDKDMTPKISDFGMARIFGRDEIEANTSKVVGTYGYMSPEYAMDGKFSMKSDVFSYGVLLLEIISGRKNRRFYNPDLVFNLLGCVWMNWKEGKGLDVVDPIIIDSSKSSSTFRPHEILRCIQVGLLCVQEYAHDRPDMSSVVFMLGNETAAIPQPKPPTYSLVSCNFEADLSSRKQRTDESWTINEVTVSGMAAR